MLLDTIRKPTGTVRTRSLAHDNIARAVMDHDADADLWSLRFCHDCREMTRPAPVIVNFRNFSGEVA